MSISFNQKLEDICNRKNNRLCIGLDPDMACFPTTREKNFQSLENFIKEIISETIEFCPIYKPNFAFFERYGSKGFQILEKIKEFTDDRALVIADAKRADIGNTASKYAYAILDSMGYDAITISPYMGRDSIEPFIKNKSKGAFILCLTSNPGALEIQNNNDDIIPVYQRVAKIACELNINNNIGLVVGATQSKLMSNLRDSSTGLPWLIPGVGVQGGNLETSIENSNRLGIGIVNVSRSILYAEDGSIQSIVNSALKYTKKIRSIL